MNGIYALIKATQGASSCFHPVPALQEIRQSVTWKRLDQARLSWHSDLELPASRTGSNRFLLYRSPPVCGILFK